MGKIDSFKHAAVRQKILEAVRTDLMGPQSSDEVLDELPTNSYITGMLYPADTNMSEDEYFDEQDFTASEYHSENETHLTTEENEPEDRQKKNFKKQASLGLSCYVESGINKLMVSVNWGSYTKKQIKKIGKVKGIEKEITQTVYEREQKSETKEIDLEKFSKIKAFPLETDSQIQLHAVQVKLNNGYKMLSVHLYNHRDNQDNKKEYESVMFQVELMLSDKELNPIFVPEHMCRAQELDDEYYYEHRAVFARGRGCAAIWEKEEDQINASSVRTSFIPDHEINGVSPIIAGFAEHTFSMRFFGVERNKIESIERLKSLSDGYQKWINKLKTSPLMERSEFQEKGKAIINDCEIANQRILAGIELLTKDDKVFQAFAFLNQTMYMQRSISMYANNNGKGIPCSLADFMKTDHSEWRPFQIAFVLLNLKGCVYPESEDRNNVDLLYFPTGGGKTEAYLGLIAFVIAYRRLTASDENEYEKDGGVTVFLRYTLRLLTTQQRDRLMRLVIAAEMMRERFPEKYGKSRISIGFWVGGGVTPNSFSDYNDEFRKKDFMRKVTKQVIVCPCCGAPIKSTDYEVNIDSSSVKITCSNNHCHFYKHNGRTLPVYLVDEEIYRKCPTVIIATVDKFATLPWKEKTGLIFGNTEKFCPRHGYIAKGEKHPGRHNATENLSKVETYSVKPFYPPELIVQDELHLITGPLGTIYGGYEEIVEELCSINQKDKKILPKYIVSTATIKNAGEQIRCLYGRTNYTQFPPKGFDIRDSYFIKEIPLASKSYNIKDEDLMYEMENIGEKPFRQYVGICGNGQSVKTTLLRVYAIILETVFELSRQKEYVDYVDPYFTLIGYFNSIRELGGAVRLLSDDVESRIERLKKKSGSHLRRYLRKTKEITSRIPSYEIAKVLEELTIGYDGKKDLKQDCYDVVIATNMIAVGMDVDRLGLMTVVGQPKQNSEYIQATSRVGRSFPGIVFTVYNPYRPRDLSHYENFEGFHSQMYRYVEGTTATPFSARARDRILHAMVIALLRLQHEEMAKNGDAGKIKNISKTVLLQVKNNILERVKIVAPKAYHEVETEIDRFIEEWIDISLENKPLVYYIGEKMKEKFNRLMNYYHAYCTPKEKPTLNSMREVEQSATIYYFNEEGM